MAYFSIFAKGTDLSAVVESGVRSGAIESVDCLLCDTSVSTEAQINVRVAMALCFRVACFDSEDELYGFVRGLDTYLEPQVDKLKALQRLASGDTAGVEDYFSNSSESSGYKDIVFLKNLEHSLIIDVLANIRRYTGTPISYDGQNFISMETGFMPIKFGGERI